jgi:hypothetical protein
MKDTLDGDSYTSITFEVEAIVYKPNEIINGCKIVKKEPNGIIHGKSEYAGIQLSIQPNMSIFNEGDVVPIIVKRVRYNVNQSAISILAIPFMPIPHEIIQYNIIDQLTKPQMEDLTVLIESIKTEEEKISLLKASDKKIYSFFADLLSSTAPNPPGKYTKINILKLLDITPAIVFKSALKYDDSNIYYMESAKDFQSNLSTILEEDDSKTKSKQLKPDISKQNIIDETVYIAYYTMLSDYLMNIQTLLNFVAYYPTFDNVQASKHLWKMYSALKK